MGAKSVIFEGSGHIVELHVPAQFVPQLDELETRHEVLDLQGFEDESEKIYRFYFGIRHAARTQVVRLERTPDGMPQFVAEVTDDDHRKLSEMFQRTDYARTLYPPPPGLQLALQNARQSSASARTILPASAQTTRPTSIYVITLGHPSDFDHSTDYSSSSLSEKVLIFEGAGQTAVFEIPEFLFPILYTCVREGMAQKKGESENTKPALDFHIIEGSINRATRFALADEGIPHFLVVATEANLDSIKKMIDEPEPYTYRISSPVPVVPALVAAPAPSEPKEKRMLYAVDGKPITESRAPGTGWGLGGVGAPQWAIDALTEEEYETLRRGGTLSE